MEDSNKISNMDAILFALSLEVVLLQMRILEGSTELRAFRWNLSDKAKQLQYDKLVRDREVVKDVVRRSLVEVAEDGTWNAFREAVNILSQKASSTLSKQVEHDRLKKSYKDCVSELYTIRNQWMSQLRETDQKAAFLLDKIKDDILNGNLRLCYAEKWLCARAEAMELQHDEKRAAPVPRADHEQRVHDELLKSYDLQIKERQINSEYWRMRYANDTAKMNERLAEKRHQLQIAAARREELQKLYELHDGEIRSWLTFKQERAARLAREERKRTSATLIQAWWRGVMVRRALGAFRFLRNLKKSPNKTKKK